MNIKLNFLYANKKATAKRIDSQWKQNSISSIKWLLSLIDNV